MTTNDQAAAFETMSAKAGWVKPEIVSFTPAVEAQGNALNVTADANNNNAPDFS